MAEKGLTRREEEVLLCVIRQYAEARKPVSSEDLKKVSSEELSASSLRAVLNSLEKKGYLVKEHVSSGRVPTDYAYRHFASAALKNFSLLETKSAASGQSELQRDLRTTAKELTETISRKHHSVGFATAPSLMDAKLSMCGLYPISRDKVLFLAVACSGRIYECVLTLRQNLPFEHLRSFSNFLNQKFKGWSFREIRSHLNLQLVEGREKVAGWALEALTLVAPAIEKLPSEVELYLDGLEWLVEIPEIAGDSSSLKALVETLERKEKLINLLDELFCNEKSPRIVLGADWPFNLNPPSLALIAVSYGTSGYGRGIVGLIGPKAMKYDEALPNLSSSAMILTSASLNLFPGGRPVV